MFKTDAFLGTARISVVAAVGLEWADHYAEPLRRHGIDARFVGGTATLADVLAEAWQVDLVVLDLALATPEMAARLGPDGPRLLAFGDPANAGLALAANLADFIDEDIDEAGLAAAIVAGVGRSRIEVRDLSDRSSARLGALGAEARRVAAALARLTASHVEAPPIKADAVRALLRGRRLRERFFPGEIFGEAAWDMLLDLTLAREEARTVSVSSLCLAAAVPASTALRAIRGLCDTGLFIRTSDKDDRRRAFIALSDPAALGMRAYLAKIAEV